MEHGYLLRKAIRYCGGKQKHLAKKMKVKPGKISYMLNYARKIKMEDAVKLQLAVDGHIKWHQLMDSEYKDIKNEYKNKIFPSMDDDNLATITFSEKVRQAMNYEKQYGKRQGQRNDLKLCENSHKVNWRTDHEIAKLFQIGSEWTYRQAKKVITKGIPELIDRMNQKKLKVWVLAILSGCSPDEQRENLCKTDKEIIAYVKQIKSVQKLSRSENPETEEKIK